MKVERSESLKVEGLTITCKHVQHPDRWGYRFGLNVNALKDKNKWEESFSDAILLCFIWQLMFQNRLQQSQLISFRPNPKMKPNKKRLEHLAAAAGWPQRRVKDLMNMIGLGAVPSVPNCFTLNPTRRVFQLSTRCEFIPAFYFLFFCQLKCIWSVEFSCLNDIYSINQKTYVSAWWVEAAEPWSFPIITSSLVPFVQQSVEKQHMSGFAY